LVDLNGDGNLEIIAGLGHLSVIDNQGNILWTKSCGSACDYLNPIIGDVDNDGDIEIVTNTDYDGGGDFEGLYVYHHDGTLMEGWPVLKERVGSPAWGTPVLGDVNGDGNIEVIVSSRGNLDAYSIDGNFINDFPILRYGSGSLNVPSLGDMDKDGDIEIGVGGDRAFVFDSYGAYSFSMIEWPTFQHDNRNSGCYKCVTCLGDFDGDNDVGITDFLILLANWGGTGPEGDIDGDGTVNINDFLLLLANWGPCGAGGQTLSAGELEQINSALENQDSRVEIEEILKDEGYDINIEEETIVR